MEVEQVARNVKAVSSILVWAIHLRAGCDDPPGFFPKEYSVICVYGVKVSAGILTPEHELQLPRGSGAVVHTSRNPSPDTRPRQAVVAARWLAMKGFLLPLLSISLAGLANK